MTNRNKTTRARHPARYLFEGAPPPGLIRLSTQRLAAKKDIKPGDKSVIHLARVVTFRDSFYGKVRLTEKLFQQMIRNFDANTYGQEIFIDVAHAPGDGAAATIKRLFLDGKKLRAEVEWSQYGIDAVKKRGFRYLSIDFTTEYVDPEDDDEKKLGAVLFGAGLTIRPRIKGLDPVKLDFGRLDGPAAIHCGFTPHIKQQLYSEQQTMNKYLKILKAALAKMTLSEPIVAQLLGAFKTTAETTDDETALQALTDQFTEIGTQLADQGAGDQALNLSIDAPGLTEDQVLALMERERQAIQLAADNEAQLLEERREQFDNLMAAAFDTENGSLRTLSDDDQTELSAARELINSSMTEDQVARLAETQITIGGRMVVAMQLSERGYQGGGQGRVHIDVDETNNIQQYQQEIRQNLLRTHAHANGTLQLAEEPPLFVRQVLDIFDTNHARELIHEGATLLGTGGSTLISDSALPYGVQRNVIAEALSDVRVLELVQTLTDAGAMATTQVPYEQRDISAVLNSGIVYEGQGIPRGGITQENDTAYITPMKISMLVSNEVAHFSRASQINWDAWGRNVASNARVMRELVVARICNELQRSADSYATADISAEAVTPDGTTRIFKTAQFPVVRPHQVRDLQGTAVGTAQSPITVTDDGSAIDEYDGSGDQAAGNYYRVLNYNMGYILICDESGAATAPAGAVTCTYSYTSNIVKVDTDLGTATIGERFNDVLRNFGERKATLYQDRFVNADYALMSATLNDAITNADNFVSGRKKEGTSLAPSGDLETIKNVPGYGTNAPGIDLGEERALIGARGALTYTIAKPFVTGAPFEAVDSNGKPTGQRQAYGEEYSAIHVPTPLRATMTSLIAYSATARAAV